MFRSFAVSRRPEFLVVLQLRTPEEDAASQDHAQLLWEESQMVFFDLERR
jgi:hypothetical protein